MNQVMLPSRVSQGHGILPNNRIARPAVPPAVPLMARFLAKLVLDILPAALASVIGGFLFTQYQFGHDAVPPRPLEQVTPASAEMMALVRDEHAVIVDYLKTQMAAEKSRQVAEDAQARDAADAETAEVKATTDAKVAAALSAKRAALVASVASRPTAPHTKAPVVAAVALRAPLVIAQADQIAAPTPEQNDGADPMDRIARNPNSLFAKTLDIKDHVVAATRHVVFMIGGMFASVGEHIGGPPTSGRQFSSDS
jgi:hypothetical protein